MLAFETFGGLDGERLAVAIRARRTINRDFKLRARCLRERPQFCRALHRHLPSPNPPRPRDLTYRARLPGSRPKMSATSPRGRSFGETGTSPRSVARKSLRRPASPPSPPAPVFFGRAIHRGRRWVFGFEPVA